MNARLSPRARWKFASNYLIVLAMASGLIATPDAWAADPAPSPTTASKDRPATLETVTGSPNKRVVLSAKAAERVDVKLGAITEQSIVSTQMFGGMIIEASNAGPPSATGRAAASANPLWVRIAVSPAELSRLDRTRPARVLPIETRTSAANIVATPVESPQQESAKSGMVPLYFAIPGTPAGLAVGSRVRAELSLAGGGEPRKTVPYSAVYYDAKGDAWVYVETGPLAFIRERVQVDRVAGDLALLSSGPALGTRVVTVGVPMLYGVEIFGK